MPLQNQGDDRTGRRSTTEGRENTREPRKHKGATVELATHAQGPKDAANVGVMLSWTGRRTWKRLYVKLANGERATDGIRPTTIADPDTTVQTRLIHILDEVHQTRLAREGHRPVTVLYRRGTKRPSPD
jgi:hypothetical protein